MPASCYQEWGQAGIPAGAPAAQSWLACLRQPDQPTISASGSPAEGEPPPAHSHPSSPNPRHFEPRITAPHGVKPSNPAPAYTQEPQRRGWRVQTWPSDKLAMSESARPRVCNLHIQAPRRCIVSSRPRALQIAAQSAGPRLHDVLPPKHAWSALRHLLDQAQCGGLCLYDGRATRLDAIGRSRRRE